MMEKSSEIRRNVEAVQEQIGRAAAEAGRDPSEIRLMAVTKTQSAARVNEAIAAASPCLGKTVRRSCWKSMTAMTARAVTFILSDICNRTRCVRSSIRCP